MLQSVLRMLWIPFPMLRTLFSCCAPPSSPDIVYMLRAMLRVCGEHVASLWRACCNQHPNIVLRTLFPCCEHLFPCCEHVFHVTPPSLLLWHSVHVASDVTSLWRVCWELVATMLRPPLNIRCKVDRQLRGRPIFSLRWTPDQKHYRKKYLYRIEFSQAISANAPVRLPSRASGEPVPRRWPLGQALERPQLLHLAHDAGVGVLVEIGPEGGRRHNSPLIVSLPSQLSRSYFHYSRRGKETRKYLTKQEMKQGNTQQTEDRRFGNCLRCSLLITVCPFHYKGFTIYRRPLSMVICLNYTFSVPDKRL
jgi:hypothetical protein